MMTTTVFAIPGDSIFPDLHRGPASESEAFRERAEAWNDWVLAEDYVAELEAQTNAGFLQAIEHVETASEEELKGFLLKTADEVEKDAPGFAAELKTVAASKSVKGTLRGKITRTLKKSRRILGWAGINLAYFTTAVTSTVSFPVVYLSKFIFGLVKGERLLESDIHAEGTIGSRVFESAVLGAGGVAVYYVILSSVLADSVAAPVLVALQVVNSVALIAACGSALEGNPTALKQCERLREIYRFFSKITDSSAIAGTRVHQWFETRVGIVLRKKRVVSKRLCSKPEHARRVARRVILRRGDDLRELAEVTSIVVGTSKNHPIDPSCTSIIVTLKAGSDPKPLVQKVSPALDGVFVEVK
ncbi:MAG: hypothetical protein JNL01_05455 [Bdellovibrionales bacterium]|nr:hypothetical protein [Bdellovibrionales bacterium]